MTYKDLQKDHFPAKSIDDLRDALRGLLKWQEVAMIGLTAAATFAILDIYAPSVGSGARTGAGFGIGAGLVGFP
jgi:hypothetical protein